MIRRFTHYWGDASLTQDQENGDLVLYDDHKQVVDDAVTQLDVLSNQVYELKKQLAEAHQKAVNAFARDYGREKY